MNSYRDSEAYRRSSKVDPFTEKPVYPLKFDLTAPASASLRAINSIRRTA